MAYFREKSYTLITSLLTAHPCLHLFFRDKTVLILGLEVSWWINIWKSFVVVKLFPMENTVRLKVFLFKFCLFNFLLFSEFGLLKFLLLLWSESSILQVLSIASPWILLICDSVLFLSHLFVNFGNLFSPFLRLKILCDYYNLLFEILLIKKSILRQRALQIV